MEKKLCSNIKFPGGTELNNILRGMLSVLLLIAFATPGLAENRPGTFNLSPFIGGYVLDNDQAEKDGVIFGLRGGYNFTKNLGAEAMFGYSRTESKQGSHDTDMYRYGIDFLYHFMPDSRFVPFVAIGGGGTNFNIPDNSSAQNHYAGLFSYGAGAKYFVTDNIAMRGDVRHIVLHHDLGDNNLEYSGGLTFQFGGKAKIASALVTAQVEKPAAAAPPKAVAVEAPKPPGATLSVTPVAIIKGESATLSWNSHDATDCTIHPAIGPVQLQGSLRITPGEDTSYTLACQGAGGSAVSKAAHVSVSIPPLPVPVVEPVKKAPPAELPAPPAIKVLFDFNKAAIKPKYHNELKKVGNFLKAQPTAKITIEGHADNVGSKKINQKLSRKRAEKGRSYIIRKFGIKGSRIATKGYASTRPVASNKHKKGRAKNRRIEATARRK
jgi:OOP family OmpA-OmpF porin